MNALDRLRRRLAATGAHGWDCVAIRADDATAILVHVAGLQSRIAELEATTVAARRCADCGRASSHLFAVATPDGTAYLGPSCYRRRHEVAQPEQLPIGGAR